MFGKRGILPMIFLAGGIVFLVLQMLELKKENSSGSVYGIISSSLLLIAMVFVYIANRKSSKN
ncbi:hypothetical protein [Robertkochia sediminum]|uniref:hypothetical protein n=1 Tax=Robertkochia sediminum TaxID=2785326 RepID=UPI001931EE2F|nr:hypothetical protein [Robertkochia sediminum]MBL7473199.1 hypothetical protein [Robertkochia sediminum]